MSVRRTQGLLDTLAGRTTMSNLAFFSHARRALCSRRGSTAIEYGLIAAGIGVVLAIAAGLVGGDLETLFADIQSYLSAE